MFLELVGERCIVEFNEETGNDILIPKRKFVT